MFYTRNPYLTFYGDYTNNISKCIMFGVYFMRTKSQLHILLYTGCSLTHGANFDSLYENPKITLFQE